MAALFDVRPFSSGSYLRDVMWADSKPSSNDLARLGGRSDLSNFNFCQSGHPVRLAVLSCGAPLLGSIGVVGSGISREEMSRITARRIVAGVADKHSFGDRTVRDYPCQAMGAIMLDAVLSVAILVKTPLPRPAFVGAAPLYFGEESRDRPLAKKLRRTRVRAVDSGIVFSRKWFSAVAARSIIRVSHDAPPCDVVRNQPGTSPARSDPTASRFSTGATRC